MTGLWVVKNVVADRRVRRDKPETPEGATGGLSNRLS
jgi:hypothetical protein